MKKILIVLLFIVFFILVKYSLSQTPKITCSVETSCSYTSVFRISSLTDGHAELNTQSNYPYIVCCRINGINLEVTQEISGGFIGLSYPTDAHIEFGDQNNYGYHLKFNPQTGIVSCDLAQSCDGYDTCLVSISAETDAHVGDCITNPYQYKICCSFGSVVVVFNINSTRVEWFDGIKGWGKVTKNGFPLQNANVTIKVNNNVYCQTTTNSSGDFECNFNIGKEKIGFSKVYAIIIDPYNLQSYTAYKDFETIFSFGYEKISSEISCEEQTEILQNLDGSVEKVKLKVCVWK